MKGKEMGKFGGGGCLALKLKKQAENNAKKSKGNGHDPRFAKIWLMLLFWEQVNEREGMRERV